MGTTPTPLEWGFPRLEPGATISFLCPRALVPPLSKPESKPPQLSGDFWDTTLVLDLLRNAVGLHAETVKEYRDEDSTSEDVRTFKTLHRREITWQISR